MPKTGLPVTGSGLVDALGAGTTAMAVLWTGCGLDVSAGVADGNAAGVVLAAGVGVAEALTHGHDGCGHTVRPDLGTLPE